MRSAPKFGTSCPVLDSFDLALLNLVQTDDSRTAEQLADRERLAQEELTDAATDSERATAQRNLAIAKDLRRAQAYYASR